MELIKKKVSDLIPYINNSRTHSEEQITQLISSIKEFGFTNPILLAPDNSIIAGHGRLLAVKRLGHEEVPCIIVQGLTKTQIKALIIADNQLALNAGWDLEKLSVEIEGLKDEDFNIDILGFKNDFILDLLNKENKGLTDDDAVPEKPINPKSKIGDVWLLGNHRLVCGDSTLPENTELMFKGQTMDLVLTDPPYGVNYSAKNEFLNKFDKGNRIQKDIKNDEIEDIKEFCSKFMSIIPFSEYNIFYIFITSQQLHNVRMALDENKFYTSTYLVWNKNNHVLGRMDYLMKHEFIIYGWKNRHKFYGNKTASVIDFDRPLKNDLHPTMKPVGLLEKLLEDGSLPNQNVYDPFLGSGSTLIACEKQNRKCFGFELDEAYTDVIINRWQQFTGKEAIHEQSGKTYNSI
jgi:DNA modification methylase